MCTSPLPLPHHSTTSLLMQGHQLGKGHRDSDRLQLASPTLITSTTTLPPRLVPRDSRAYPTIDTWDEIVEAMMEIAPTTLEGVDQRVTELDTTVRQRTEEFLTQLTSALGRIETLEARDPEPRRTTNAGSSSCHASICSNPV
ncbi:hypothetical protein Tco_1070339 [Tanacetum coccineum]|uniref:Uncharacterized protein n=1 Tax=Tanacetum coccineum TaxID=301880 RepID=A0ABQ5HL24_9ASTR